MKVKNFRVYFSIKIAKTFGEVSAPPVSNRKVMLFVPGNFISIFNILFYRLCTSANNIS